MMKITQDDLVRELESIHEYMKENTDDFTAIQTATIHSLSNIEKSSSIWNDRNIVHLTQKLIIILEGK